MSVLKRIRGWIRQNEDVVLLIQLLISFGLAGAVTDRIRTVISVDSRLFWISMFGLISGVCLLVTRLLLVRLPLSAPSPARKPSPATSRWSASAVEAPKPKVTVPTVRTKTAAEKNYEKKLRVAVHEVITTLEHHQEILREWNTQHGDFTPGYQGDWPVSRLLVSERWENDDAVRATERAFQAVSKVDRYSEFDPSEKRTAALRAISEAVYQLNALLMRYAPTS
jgi:hypothetical protein